MANTVMERIGETLEYLCQDEQTPMEGVWYGACRERELDSWNYFVYNRKKSKKATGNRIDLQTYYEIHIIHEDYIPEGYVENVIEALQAEAGQGTKLKLTDDDITYDYVPKGSTGMYVEIATLTFFHPEKRF